MLPIDDLTDGQAGLGVIQDIINRVRLVCEDASTDIAFGNSIGHLCGKYLEYQNIGGPAGTRTNGVYFPMPSAGLYT